MGEKPAHLSFFKTTACSSAFACSTRCADKTAFLIDKRFLSAFRASLSAGLGAVREIFFKSALHSHFPCVYALGVEFEAADKFQHLIYRHTIT